MGCYILVRNIEQLLRIKTSTWVDNAACYLELWALKLSVLIFTSLNRITIPSTWQIIPLSLSWLIHSHNFTQETPFLIPAWPHSCCQASSWTLKTRFQQHFLTLTFLWRREGSFYLLSQQIPAWFVLFPVNFLLSASRVVHLCISDSDDLSSSLLRHQTCQHHPHRRHQLQKKTPLFFILLF